MLNSNGFLVGINLFIRYLAIFFFLSVFVKLRVNYCNLGKLVLLPG